MLIVAMRREVEWDLLAGPMYDTVLYIADTDDPRAAVEKAIAAWQAKCGSANLWLSYFADGQELDVDVYPIRPGILSEPLYSDIFNPGEWAVCVTCGSATRMWEECLGCSGLVCPDCQQSHTCELAS